MKSINLIKLVLVLTLELIMVRHMTKEERLRAVGMAEAGRSCKAIARYFGRAPKTIRELLAKWRRTGAVLHGNCGRVRRQTTQRADRRLARLARANRTLPATLLRLMWGEKGHLGQILSSDTIRARLRQSGLRSRRMRKRLQLSPAHVAARERWAMQRAHWRIQQWRRVVFTDETRFRLFKSDGRVRVWRGPGQAFQPDCVQMHESQGISVHVWAGIALNGRTELVVLDRNVSGETYAEILQQHFVPFANTKFGGLQHCILQDDNAPPHRAASVRELKEELGIRTLRWPSRSPDMNPIEHVWDLMKRRIHQHNHPPQNANELGQAIAEAWQQLPQVIINRLVLSMTRRVAALLRARGAYTHY